MDTRLVVNEFFSKSAQNDLTLVNLFADKTDLLLPGDPKLFPWAGRHTQGGAPLVDVFKAVWASRTAGKGSALSTHLVVEGENAAWFGFGVSHEMNEFSRRSGHRFIIDVAMLFTVRGGRIARLHVIEDMTALAADHGFIELREIP